MRCTRCGTEFAFGQFCPDCGTPAPSASQAQSGMQTHAPVKPVIREMRSPTPERRKGGKKWIAVIVAVLVIALVVGALSVLQTGPLNTLVTAAKHTLDSGSFTVKVTATDGDYSNDVLIMVEFDPEEEILNLYMETEYDDGSTDVLGIYDGYIFEKYEDEAYDYYYCNYADASDSLEEFFTFYRENTDAFDRVFDPFRLPSDRDDLLMILENFDDVMDGEFSDVMDLEVLADCILEYNAQLNDEGWLEEFAGYQEDYLFEPDLYDFLDESLPYFETAFEDEDLYDEIYGDMRDSRNDLREVELTLECTLKSGGVAELRIENEYVEVTFTVYDVGKTEPDLDELDSLLEECMDYD